MAASATGVERSGQTVPHHRPGVPLDGPFTPVLRKLCPVDQAHIEAHLMRLAPSDRRMRFCGTASDQATIAYSKSIDWSDTIMLGCFVDGHLRGMAELRVFGEHAYATAELAITVEQAFQNKGIGTTLIQRMLAIARNRFVSKVNMICLSENHKMQHVVAKLEADLTVSEGEAEASIWPAVPTYLSLIEEVSMDGQALWRAMFEPSTTIMPPVHPSPR